MAASDEYSMKEAKALYLASLKMDDKFLELRIKEIWDNQMGKPISSRTTSMVFKNHVLNIRLSSAVLRNELLSQRALILSRLNDAIGGDRIKEIYFK